MVKNWDMFYCMYRIEIKLKCTFSNNPSRTNLLRVHNYVAWSQRKFQVSDVIRDSYSPFFLLWFQNRVGQNIILRFFPYVFFLGAMIRILVQLMNILMNWTTVWKEHLSWTYLLKTVSWHFCTCLSCMYRKMQIWHMMTIITTFDDKVSPLSGEIFTFDK